MAIASVKRSPDASGDNITTYLLPDGTHAQAIIVIDSAGNLLGTIANPLQVGTQDEASILALLQDLGTVLNPVNVVTAQEANILAAVQALAEYAVNDVVSPSATLTYVGKESASGAWLVQSVNTATGVVVRYASIANNPLVTDYATAWAGRAALTYGLYSEAVV